MTTKKDFFIKCDDIKHNNAIVTLSFCDKCDQKDAEISHLRKHVKVLTEALEDYDLTNARLLGVPEGAITEQGSTNAD